MKYILGKKVGMTQMFDEAGNVVPVTLVHAEKNIVTQVRTVEKDGYSAVQIGHSTKRVLRKPQAGHVKELPNVRNLKEFRVSATDKNRGDALDVTQFNVGDLVKVSGVSKGKGFQGVVKRHGFHGAPASHGTKHALRSPGSIGATWPQRVIKGMRMAGRMGGVQVSVRNIRVVAVDGDKEILALAGALPGKPGTVLSILGK
ncbi:MAG: 50S ribosomal protein L3 [Candidatus Sungbacteria bacterium RIFCSPLOWO2_02_FULL_48_13b]|uniref:Large ribosomal subunit protein uL3 n=2 Tax=Candidatus Sungiibacteriota TaxID=1817917 RepID=A0A1G2LDX7_9BACT|nr:MAG: 50S ribosomal protein L3 [Candidatus Sungbacteria bacterium RIFCSPHIGHO2_02_FULL_49_20]OHA09833.1 MAG: 50S ribosomal protein L3 [Candidatus Sungbacteria bacterium RIFCSPLOWO2_02_FULL_48_13b]